MEPNVRHCRPPPSPASPSSAVIATGCELAPVSSARPASADPRLSPASASPCVTTLDATAASSETATSNKKPARSSGLRKSRTATPTSGGSKLKLRQATSDAIQSQSEPRNGGNKGGNSVTGNEVVHRLRLRHANSELTTESSSIGDCSSNNNNNNNSNNIGAAVRTSSNLESSTQYNTNGGSQMKAAGPVSASSMPSASNNSNRPSFGRYIESGGVEIAARPQSVLAIMGSPKSPERNSSSCSNRIRERGEQLQQQKQQNQHPNTNISANTNPHPHPPRSKTTRVRINSTSEQIQDPNWLIRMSREIELQQQQQRQKKSHLKLLHRKLKSTITGHHHHHESSSLTGKDHHSTDAPYIGSNRQIQGSTTSSNITSSSSGAITSSKNGNDSNKNEISSNSEAQDKSPASLLSGSAFSAPLVPQTPVKVPVSILKQRPPMNTPSSTSTSNHSPAFIHHQQQFFKTISNQTSRVKSPVQAHVSIVRTAAVGKTAKQSANKQHKQQQQQQPPQAALAKPSISPSSVTFQTDMSQDTSGGQQKAAQPEPSAPKPTPICADGQVKVSGWKRNNLLAKTLSHFDEIRGNQRPIFLPTKIMLPAENLGHNRQPVITNSTPATTGTTNLANFRPGKSKFAEVVREAVSKRNLVIAGLKQASDTTNNPQVNNTGNQLATTQPQGQEEGGAGTGTGTGTISKRASYCLGTQEYATNEGDNEIAKLYNQQHHVSTRAISAEPSVHHNTHSVAHLHQVVGGSAGNMQQHRSSFTGTGRDSFCANSRSNSPTTPHALTNNLNLNNQISSKQQVIGKKHSVGGGGSGSGSSPGNSHSTLPHVSPQLVSQLLMSHAASSALSEASSSRSFKLQHKNQQVLQHLKHQLDPESSGGHAHQHQSGTHHHSGHHNSTHIKDWKRLTNKLSLLTSSRNIKSNQAGANQPSNDIESNHHLTVKDDSVLLGATNKTGNSTPLRLTVSNQESGGKKEFNQSEGSDEKHGTSSPFSLRFMQKRNSTSNQNNHSPSSALRVPDSSFSSSSCSGPRKLSSSSMVVQSTKANSDNKLGISSSVGSRDSTQQTSNVRRSSDSEAYRVPCSTAPEANYYVQQQQQQQQRQTHERDEPSKCESRGSAISLQSNTSNNSNGGASKQPIVVHRNDLLQLLQVASRQQQQRQRGTTASNSSGGEHSDSEGSIKDNEKHRHSLQLNAASAAHPGQAMMQDGGARDGIAERNVENKCELIGFSEANREGYEGRRESLGRSISLNSVEIQLAAPSCDGPNRSEDKEQFSEAAVRSSLSDTPPSSLIPIAADTKVTSETETTTTMPAGLFGPDSRPKGTVLDGNLDQAELEELNDNNDNGGTETDDAYLCPQNQTAKSLLQRSTDLSWVVKKTSKVAFFQQKLRNLRWHLKQRKHSGENSPGTSEAVPKSLAMQPQIATLNNNNASKQQEKLSPSSAIKDKEAANGEDTRDENESDAAAAAAAANSHDLEMGPSDVFMDPTLIGDAIEIFLRNTMQQHQQKQLFQQQKRPHRRESTGEPTRKEGVALASEIDRRISLSIEASLVEPTQTEPPLLSSYQPQSEVISSSSKPSSPAQASIPRAEAKLSSS